MALQKLQKKRVSTNSLQLSPEFEFLPIIIFFNRHRNVFARKITEYVFSDASAKLIMFNRRWPMKILTVMDVIEQLGVTRASLCYWEEVGKIPRARRTSTGRRYFFPSDLSKIKEFAEGNRVRLRAAETLRTTRRHVREIKSSRTSIKV